MLASLAVTGRARYVTVNVTLLSNPVLTSKLYKEILEKVSQISGIQWNNWYFPDCHGCRRGREQLWCSELRCRSSDGPEEAVEIRKALAETTGADAADAVSNCSTVL